MSIDITADPIEVTLTILGTDEFWIAVGTPIETSTSLYAVLSKFPYAAINPSLNQIVKEIEITKMCQQS
jgi:hypothetical protein